MTPFTLDRLFAFLFFSLLRPISCPGVVDLAHLCTRDRLIGGHINSCSETVSNVCYTFVVYGDDPRTHQMWKQQCRTLKLRYIMLQTNEPVC